MRSLVLTRIKLSLFLLFSVKFKYLIERHLLEQVTRFRLPGVNSKRELQTMHIPFLLGPDDSSIVSSQSGQTIWSYPIIHPGPREVKGGVY